MPLSLFAQSPAQDGFFTTSDHVKLHYLESGQGQAILLIPGWLMPADIWQLQLKGLSKNYHVIALDPRSQGQSDMVKTGNDPLRRSTDIRELLDHLHLGSVVLVGWSLGAFDCLAYLNQFGDDKLFGLILVDSPLGAASGTRPVQRSNFLLNFQADRAQADINYAWGLFKRSASREFLKKLTDAADRVPTDIALQALDNTQPGDAWQPSLRAMQGIPLLYAITNKFTSQGAYLRQAAPQARVEMFENSGHGLFVDESIRFNNLIQDFIKQSSLYPAGLPKGAGKSNPLAVQPLSIESALPTLIPTETSTPAPLLTPTVETQPLQSPSPTPAPSRLQTFLQSWNPFHPAIPTQVPMPIPPEVVSNTPPPFTGTSTAPPFPTATTTETTTPTVLGTPIMESTPTALASPHETSTPTLTPNPKGFLNTIRSLNLFHSEPYTPTATETLVPESTPSPILTDTVVAQTPKRVTSEISVNPIQDGYFYTSDHVKLHYLEAGQGLPLVLIPGWLIPAEIWTPQLEDLSSDYRVIALDPRSQGESDMTPHGDEPQRQAQDIQELLDHLQLSSVVLVGWSHGGFQVLAYMNEFGTNRLYAVGLVDSALAASTPVTSAAEDRFLDEFKQNRPHAVRSFVWSLFKTQPPGDFFRKLADDATRTPTDIALALMNNVFPGDSWQPPFKTICQVPLLYAVTSKYTAQSEYLAKADPQARVEIFSNAGHALFYDEPDHFDNLMRDFLRRAALYPGDVPHKALHKMKSAAKMKAAGAQTPQPNKN